MGYITIKEFAKKHKVTRQAIEYALSGKIKNRHGVNVILESTKYKKVRRNKKKSCKD